MVNPLYGIEWLPLPRAPEMAEIDRRARDEAGVPERLLMENAGRVIAQTAQTLFPEGEVVGVVGSGHNGADTYIALRTLRTWGRSVRWIQAASQPPDPALAHGWNVPPVPDPEFDTTLASAGLVLDGILGTGVTGAPRKPQAKLIERINRLAPRVLAVDGPSGVDFSTGAVPGACVDADVTLSLGYPKLGLLFQPARARCGRLLAAEIAFPSVGEDEVAAAAITPAWARRRTPRRAPDAHKGDSGYLLAVAGREGMAGAGALVTRGALTIGAGIVRIASDPANRTIYQTAAPESIFVDVDDDAAMAEAGAWAHAVVIGPGLGRDERAAERLARALESTGDLPVLIDADGLNLFEGRPDDLAAVAEARPTAITPHPGEMSRVLGLPISEIVADPVAISRSAAHRLGAAVLLKGAPSVVAWDHEPALVCTSGSSAAAVGGSGDVLSGACGAFLAAGARPREALALGLFYCGRAAELGPDRGRSSLELARSLPAALADPGAETPPWPYVVFDQAPRR